MLSSGMARGRSAIEIEANVAGLTMSRTLAEAARVWLGPEPNLAETRGVSETGGSENPADED